MVVVGVDRLAAGAEGGVGGVLLAETIHAQGVGGQPGRLAGDEFGDEAADAGGVLDAADHARGGDDQAADLFRLADQEAAVGGDGGEAAAFLDDDGFADAERAAIRRLLADRYHLTGPETDALIRSASEAQDHSVGLYRQIRRITDGYDAQGRIALIEMLWEVAYADGRLDPDEDALVRRIAGLVHVSDQDRGAARKRVLARLAQ